MVNTTKLPQSLLLLSATLLLLTVSIVIGFWGYLNATDPKTNHFVKAQNDANQKEIDSLDLLLQRQWKWFPYSDVAVSKESYPMVVMRSGYKILKIKDGKALVGWQYEVMNTSPANDYVATVQLDITDGDGFKVQGSKKIEKVRRNSYSAIRSTVEIDSDDIERLDSTDWSISLSPNWEIKEKQTKRKRYERFAALVVSEAAPWWVYETYGASKSPPFSASLDEKWKIVIQALKIKEGKEQL